MPIPVRPRTDSVDPAYWIEQSDDGSRTLVRRVDGVAFHSGCGAAAECDHVYLDNGGLTGEPDGWPSLILEVGLGTTLAMLRTLDRVLAVDRPLQYHAVESHPLSGGVLAELDLSRGLQFPELVERFLHWWPTSESTAPGDVAIWQVDPQRSVSIWRSDLREGLPAAIPVVDTIYFDPFDPATNPELWQPPVLGELLDRVRPGGRLVTYCVKSDVRRALETVGWQTNRVPGPPGGKREVMIARRLTNEG